MVYFALYKDLLIGEACKEISGFRGFKFKTESKHFVRRRPFFTTFT